MVRAAACLDRDDGWRKLFEKTHHFPASQLFAKYGPLCCIDTMQLKNLL